MRLCKLAALIWGLWAGMAGAFEVEDHVVYPAKAAPERVLRVISTTDQGVFEPFVLAFQQVHPAVRVEYTITGTSELMKALYAEQAVFDVAISSAMDLQTKLANDGYAQTYDGAATGGLPAWATWRNQLFAFTQEPAVLVLSETQFPPGSEPRTRDELIEILRADPERFQGRVGTYDVRRSGFGYLMATQDSRNSEAFWRLMEVMGRLEARLYCCSGDMIRDVASGELALAYNVLGTYAASQVDKIDGLRIVVLSDYVNVMLRTALIPTTAQNTADAQRMVDFLLGFAERPELAGASGLTPIDEAVLRGNSALRPIRFGPGLLVFLDQLRRRNFLRSWTSSLVQE